MNRKQLSEFSHDELRILRWKYFETIPANHNEQEKIRQIIKRIEKEIFVKQNESITNL